MPAQLPVGCVPESSPCRFSVMRCAQRACCAACAVSGRGSNEGRERTRDEGQLRVADGVPVSRESIPVRMSRLESLRHDERRLPDPRHAGERPLPGRAAAISRRSRAWQPRIGHIGRPMAVPARPSGAEGIRLASARVIIGHPPSRRKIARAQEFIEARNSSLSSVSLILPSRNSIESTGERGASTLRKMYIRLSVFSSINSSSRRVAERLMSIAG